MRSTMSTFDLLKNVFDAMRMVEKYKGIWLTDAFLVDAMKSVLSNMATANTIEVKRGSVNQIIGKKYPDCQRYDGSNTSGVYRVIFSKTYYYYLAKNKNNKPEYPSGTAAWKRQVLDGLRGLDRINRSESQEMMEAAQQVQVPSLQ